MQTEAYFLKLLSRKLAGEATVAELRQLEELIAQNNSWRFVHDNLVNKYPDIDLNKDKDEAEQAYAAHIVKLQLLGKLDANDTFHHATIKFWTPGKKWLTAAAIIIGLLSGTLLFHFYNPNTISGKVLATKNLNEISTKKGSKSMVKLPDGTDVWLNSDTKITYSNNEINKTRDVTLTGEAFFDVAHDSSKPFIIHTGNINIKVLGTAFNVRNYSNDGTVETSLIRGKIEVTINNRPNQKFILNPYEKLIVPNKTLEIPETVATSDRKALVSIIPISQKKDSSLAETAWLKDQLVFDNQSLEDIAFELERNYNVKVVFSGNEAKSYRYTASFTHIGVDKILGMLSISKKITFTITDSVITISK